MKKIFFLVLSLCFLSACGGFQAKRVGSDESDEKALEITDKWVQRDTENAVEEILTQIKEHRGFRRYLQEHGGVPTVFIAEVQNLTSEPYFPIQDINDEFLYELSSSGDFILVDADARDKVLEEIQYQNDGMVDSQTAKEVGKQTGADLMIFGNVQMQPRSRDGETIKQYSVNLRMTDVERAVEVVRVRTKVSKYSEQSSFGW